MEKTFNTISNIENIPEYFYTDNHEEKHGEVIFTCRAVTMDEADALFEKKFGYNPRKNSSIGCVTEAVNNKKWIEDYKAGRHQE